MAIISCTTKLPTFFILLLLTHNSLASTGNDDNLITQTCKNTPNFNLCVSTLNADPRGPKARDVKTLALIMIDVVKAKATIVYDQVKKLLAMRSDLKKPLMECADGYDFVVNDDYAEAVEAVTDGVPKFGEDAMRNSATQPLYCEDLFKQYGKTSPLIQLNYVVHDVASVAVYIIRMLL